MSDYYVATTGNDTTGDGSSGNPYASLGKAVTVAQAGAAGWNIYIKTGSYSVTSTTANANGGVISLTQNGTEAALNRILAYTTTPGDGGTAILSASGISSCTMIACTAHRTCVDGVEVNGNSLTSIRGFNSTSGYTLRLRNCIARNCTNYGFNVGGPFLFRCQAIGCSDRGYQVLAPSILFGCAASACSGFGLVFNAGSKGVSCVSYSHTGANGYGFYINNGDSAELVGCTAYGCSKSGFIFGGTNNYDSDFINCLSYGNTTYGFEAGAARAANALTNCAAGGNTSGNLHANLSGANSVTALTGDPFTDAASGDFSLNNTAGAGADCRAAGIGPAGQTSYIDIGAVQHQDSGGGGGYAPVGPSFIRGIS